MAVAVFLTTKPEVDQALTDPSPLILDFYSPRSGPTVILNKIQQLASEMQDIRFCLVDVDKAPQVAREHGVLREKLLTFLFFRGGRKVYELRDPDEVIELIDAIEENFAR